MAFNTGLKRFETSDVNTFTSDIGIKLRKFIHPIWGPLLKLCTSRKVIVEEYPQLEKGKVYIFVANHSFDEDAISILQTIDRSAYVLQGSTDQMEHNPVFLALWLHGMIYVNRLDKNSRSDAIKKMTRVLQSGTSVVLFPEGAYNNSENQLIMPLFSSPYILGKELGVEVVPMISFNESGSDKIYIRVGKPVNLAQYEKYEAMAVLRDKMSTLLYQIIEEHTMPIKRKDLGLYPRIAFMAERQKVYDCQKWHRDVWEEEFSHYMGHGVTTPQQSRMYVDKVQVNIKNAKILADVLVRREEDKRYDMKEYLHKNVKLIVQKGEVN